jgi:hypothetical protein
MLSRNNAAKEALQNLTAVHGGLPIRPTKNQFRKVLLVGVSII